MLAAGSGHTDTMQALAALGADIHIQDSVVSPTTGPMYTTRIDISHLFVQTKYDYITIIKFYIRHMYYLLALCLSIK